MQRVPLLAYNAPLLRTSTSQINFGFCLYQTSETSHAGEAVATDGGTDGTRELPSLRCRLVQPLFVTNIGAIRSNCMLQMPSAAAIQGAYTASPSFAVLEPGQVQRFDISFSPQAKKQYSKLPTLCFWSVCLSILPCVRPSVYLICLYLTQGSCCMITYFVKTALCRSLAQALRRTPFN